MELIMKLLAFALKCISIYTVVIGLFALLPRHATPRAAAQTRFAVLIAARNEETVIDASVASLLAQDYPNELYDVFVIPNNCTDRTEEAARRAGAKIITCQGTVRCKGDALHQAVEQLIGRYDAYCVFDADNLVAPDFLSRMNDAVASGARAAKGRHTAANPYSSWISGCYDLYFQNFDLLYSRPRARVGLSAKLVGTGFLFTDELIQSLGGWNTVTMAEDAEFAAQCALAGIQVRYVPEAVCYDEQPLTFKTSLKQRRRWCAGVQSVARRYLPRFTAGRFSWLRLDFAVFLSMTYVPLLAVIVLCNRLAHMTLSGAALTLGISLAGYWLGMTATALLLSIAGRKNLRKMTGAVALYPVFMASWYPLQLLALMVQPGSWAQIVHTGEHSDRQLPRLRHLP